MSEEPKNRVDFELTNEWFIPSSRKRRLLEFSNKNTKASNKRLKNNNNRTGNKPLDFCLRSWDKIRNDRETHAKMIPFNFKRKLSTKEIAVHCENTLRQMQQEAEGLAAIRNKMKNNAREVFNYKASCRRTIYPKATELAVNRIFGKINPKQVYIVEPDILKLLSSYGRANYSRKGKKRTLQNSLTNKVTRGQRC